MRAILRFMYHADSDGLQSTLEAMSWIPKGKDEESRRQADNILDDVAINREQVEATLLLQVLDATTETWGSSAIRRDTGSRSASRTRTRSSYAAPAPGSSTTSGGASGSSPPPGASML